MPENVRIPSEGISKVIQLSIDDQSVLRAGDNNDYHGNILKAALDEFEVPYKEIVLSGGRKGPEKEGKHYKLVGAGLCRHIHGYATLYFGSDSTDYGIGINEEHINKCMPEFEKKGLKVKFIKF